LFARRLGPAGEVTGVAPTPPTLALHGMRFVSGTGVLARVVGLFSARGYNIESLTVAETDRAAHASRITIVTSGQPIILDQIKAQLERITLGSFTTETRARFLDLLATLTPTGLTRIQMFSGGAEAVEAALRLAIALDGRLDASPPPESSQSWLDTVAGAAARVGGFARDHARDVVDVLSGKAARDALLGGATDAAKDALKDLWVPLAIAGAVGVGDGRRARQVPAGVVPGLRARRTGQRRTAPAADRHRRAQRGAADAARARPRQLAGC